jgi:hypothetical protein
VPELSKVFSHMFGRSISVKLDVMGKTQPQASAATLLSKPPESPVAAPPEIPVTIPAPVVDQPKPELAKPPELKIAPPELAVVDQPAPALPVDLFADPSLDFAEPPDSLDLERAEQTPEIELEEPDLDPILQAATEHIVKTFNGEIIERNHELFDQIVGE